MVAEKGTVAIAGFDCRIDEDGASRAWRMISVWRSEGLRGTQTRIGPLPDGLRWLSIPRDPLYGDLLTLGGRTLAAQAADIAEELVRNGVRAMLVGDLRCDVGLMGGLVRHGIDVRPVKGYEHGTTCESFVPAMEFPGDAGREIAAIRQMTGAGS